jgi:hypothetical protein
MIKLYATVAKIEEKFREVWVEGSGKDAKFETQSLGWYVQFNGSSESICLWDTKPNWQPDDSVTISFENLTRHD